MRYLHPIAWENDVKPSWQFKVVKSQRGMDGRWFNYPAAATFVEEAEAQHYAQEFADEQRADGVGGTRILVISRRKFEGPIGPTNSVAEYSTDRDR